MAESPTRPRQNTLARVLVISCGQKPEAAAVPRPSRPRVSVCNTGVSSLRSAGGGAAHVITPESGRPVADLVLFCGPPDPSQPSSVFDAVLPLDLQRKIDFVESVRELGGGEAFLAVPFGNVWLAQKPWKPFDVLGTRTVAEHFDLGDGKKIETADMSSGDGLSSWGNVHA